MHKRETGHEGGRSGPVAVTFAVAVFAMGLAACGGSGGDDNAPPEPPSPAAPTISVASASGTNVNRTATLEATVAAEANVTRVEFLVDGTVIANLTAEPFTTEWDTSTVEDGAHTVTGRVTDTTNAVATSEEVEVTVDNHPTIAVTLSPLETWPLPNSTATGSGELTFDLLSGAVTGSVTVQGIPATLAHIHQGFAGTAGPVIVDFAQSTSDPNVWGPVTGGMLTAEQIDALFAGQLYVNVHSDAFPAGEIRGQIRPSNIVVLHTPMSGDEVVPAVSTRATAVAATTIDALAGTATVHVNSTGVEDATEAHVHVAATGETNEEALLTLSQDAADPTHWFIEGEPVAAADRDSFDQNAWYVDIHTPANPGGELRGQVTPNPEEPPPPAAAVTLAELQTNVFSPRCASCHTGSGGSLPGSMNLSSAEASFAALVNVASEEQPSLLRVAPNDPDNSYLVHKIEGRPGIVGGRMPLGGPFLDEATIAAVKSWIEGGAQP